MTRINKQIQVFITFWKWINIFNIVAGMIIFSISLLKGRYIFENTESIHMPFLLSISISLFGLILSILIVYGIINKKEIGLYSSYLLIIFSSIMLTIYSVNSKSTYEFVVYIITIIANLGMGYALYRGKNYFNSN